MRPMARISRVLVGMDFDEASTSALKMADVLASAWKADLTVLHAATLDVPAYFTAAQIERLEAERQQTRERTADRLRTYAEGHVQRAVHVVVEEGPPQDALLRMAASFDVVVVGTHRRHGARRWWLGSVAEAVVRQSLGPVLVVPAGAIVPDADRPLTILAAGGDVAEGAAWVDVLRSTLGGNVVRSLDIHQCAPERLQNADLIVVSMPASTDTHGQFPSIVEVLKECMRPVLFVPLSEGMFERSSS